MASPWTLYQRQPSFVLGFHGTEKAIVDGLLSGQEKHLSSSKGLYEWLGHGIYFWENDPQRGLDWALNGNAKKKIIDPDVVGAILDLGHCLDLTTQTGLTEVHEAFTTLQRTYATLDQPLPSNKGGKDKVMRELD